LSYKVLVLPQLHTMRPEVLERLSALVAAGGILMGPMPDRSPSLQDYGRADERVRNMAAALSGHVLTGRNLDSVFQELRLPPDMAGPDSLLFIHRATSVSDIYFVSNQTPHAMTCAPTFRVHGLAPVLWDPLTGTTRALPEFESSGEVTKVPLRLEGYQSYFVVFSAGGARPSGMNFPTPKVIEDIRGPWTVRFDTAMRGPARPVVFDTLVDWRQHPDSAIRFYSGKAVYTHPVRLSALPAGQHLYLDLGTVMAMAKVRVNGVYVGGAWTPPYRVDISKAVKKGDNLLEIEVVNTWVNRLIGDSRLPPAKRRTWMDVNPYRPDNALVASGLLGPVRIVVAP
jgi:hypothetical protein